MRILIDNHQGIEVTGQWAKNEEGELVLVLPFLENAKVMDAWQAADPAHRSYRYGDVSSDSDPSVLIVAWIARNNGSLVMADIEPHYDGVGDINAYALDDLSEALGIDVLKWGAAIDEPVDAGGWEDH